MLVKFTLSGGRKVIIDVARIIAATEEEWGCVVHIATPSKNERVDLPGVSLDDIYGVAGIDEVLTPNQENTFSTPEMWARARTQ